MRNLALTTMDYLWWWTVWIYSKLTLLSHLIASFDCYLHRLYCGSLPRGTIPLLQFAALGTTRTIVFVILDGNLSTGIGGCIWR